MLSELVVLVGMSRSVAVFYDCMVQTASESGCVEDLQHYSFYMDLPEERQAKVRSVVFNVIQMQRDLDDLVNEGFGLHLGCRTV